MPQKSRFSLTVNKIELTNKISETMDQLRFNEISPKKINTKARKKLKLGVNKEMQRKTEEVARPNPQIRGSARGSFGLHLVLAKLPRGTPMIPDIMVITPNTKATLK